MFKKSCFGLFFIAIGTYHLGNVYTLGVNILTKAVLSETIIAVMLFALGIMLIWQGKRLFIGRSYRVFFYKSIIITLCLVLFVREFIIEPVMIVSGSMLPTLKVGEYLLILKYTYGYRIPFSRMKVFMNQGPERGDIVVFSFASDPGKNYIKRVVGLPGDYITYDNNRLVINGVPIAAEADGSYEYLNDQDELQIDNCFIEHLGRTPHRILDQPMTMHAKNSQWIVKANHYFVLGDNRDASNDSRFLGQVPAYRLVGKASGFNLNEIGMLF